MLAGAGAAAGAAAGARGVARLLRAAARAPPARARSGGGSGGGKPAALRAAKPPKPPKQPKPARQAKRLPSARELLSRVSGRTVPKGVWLFIALPVFGLQHDQAENAFLAVVTDCMLDVERHDVVDTRLVQLGPRRRGGGPGPGPGLADWPSPAVRDALREVAGVGLVTVAWAWARTSRLLTQLPRPLASAAAARVRLRAVGEACLAAHVVNLLIALMRHHIYDTAAAGIEPLLVAQVEARQAGRNWAECWERHGLVPEEFLAAQADHSAAGWYAITVVGLAVRLIAARAPFALMANIPAAASLHTQPLWKVQNELREGVGVSS